MAPNSEWKVPSISRKFPSYRNESFITVESWLEGRRREDEAEGLWRIHDKLYDLENFAKNHPGGQFWIAETKGTDITEAFETHHLNGRAEKILPKYFVRDAKESRNIILTLNDDGFYKVLKKRVVEKLNELDYRPVETTKMIHNVILAGTLILPMLYARYNNWLLLILAGLMMCWNAIIGHNYFHRKDNWRMYTFNLSLMNVSEWRISHVLSHHFYANTFHDLELSLVEPILCWVPNPYIKSKTKRILSSLYSPIFYTLAFKIQFSLRVYRSVLVANELYWHDLIGFSIPLLMVFTANASILTVLFRWLLIVSVSSFSFNLIGLNAAHHDPEIYHEGDAHRKDRDWGIFQLDTIVDRRDLKGSHFLVLTHFGDHILHHFFPTLDHGILQQIYPILFEVMDEFKVGIRDQSFLSHLIGQQKQLNRSSPNLIQPGEKKIN